MIGVVHLVWGPLGVEPVRRFLDSYRAFDAGLEHELVVLLNGVGSAQRKELAIALEGIEHRAVSTPDPVQDLTAYGYAASVLEHQQLCFLNSHSVILASSWLAALRAALDQPEAGIVGASGSWGSIRSYLRFSLGLGGDYREVFADRRATIATLEAITARQDREVARSSPQRRIPVVSYAAAVLDQAHGFMRFPAHHIRTTSFMTHRDIFRELQIPPLRRKNDAYRLESGHNSITSQIRRRGLQALVVARDGSSFYPDHWHASRTFWQGEQENLLVADKQTASYEHGSAREREVLSRYAWGEHADSTAPLSAHSSGAAEAPVDQAQDRQ